jgi:hypothetical protein
VAAASLLMRQRLFFLRTFFIDVKKISERGLVEWKKSVNFAGALRNARLKYKTQTT